MRFGYFDGQNREYVITRPDTPLPWINYLGESEYCALISQTAGGYSFFIDPREQRILRYRYDNVPFDQGGRYFFIRDNVNGKYFSPTWAPVYEKLDRYECRHGLGYTTIESEKGGIETELTYFVPLGEDLEIVKAEVRNVGKGTRDLTLFSYVEFCLWDAVGDATNFQRTWSIGRAHCEGSTIVHDTLFGNWKDIFAYFHCSEKIDGFDCQRKAFLGNDGYTPLQRPEAVVKGECSGSVAIGWAPVGVHCLRFKLKPGQKKTLVFILGVAPQMQKAKLKMKKFSGPALVDRELKKVKEYWDGNLSRFQVETPDKDVDLALNIWNQYQCRQTFAWSRYASYYESGIGRGMGFRDSFQDTLGFAHMIPEKVRRRILDLAAMQFPDGSTFHQYSPITGKGDLIGYSDDPLWMVYAVANYIKETGDFGILEEKVPFAAIGDRPPVQVGHHDYGKVSSKQKAVSNKASLYEHMKIGIKRVWKDRGKHGLPLSKFSDWNDCLNMLGDKYRAESVLVGFMLVAACRDLIELLESNGPKLRDKTPDIKEYRKISEEMKKALEKSAWDGDWFKRAYDNDGRPVGSKTSAEGKIFLEPQPWSVISGAVGVREGMTAMDSVYKRLFTEYGIKLLDPAFRHYHPELGEISTYPPGLKENASVFCHPNPWAIIAECMLKRGDRAFEYYKAILPMAQNDRAEIRKAEPYVYCQMVAGPDHPDFGEGKNSWLTGSAAWNFYAASQYILGVRPDYKGLIIDPCLPKSWRNFTVTRTFRGARYIIKVKRHGAGNNQVKFLVVDGRKIDGNIAPVFSDRKEHTIEALI
ncbi:MAG TPA: glycosyl transferase [Candidatus Omnitrophota bacterium]|nr:glycosyl transferase [Candidatus Omnitrophota bacterium]